MYDPAPIYKPGQVPGFLLALPYYPCLMATPSSFTNPADGLLYNNVRATSETQLDRIEADMSTKRMMMVRSQLGLPLLRQAPGAIVGPAYPLPPAPLNFDEQHLRAMHCYTFQDVYPWAGETRQDRRFQGYKEVPKVQADHLMTYTNHRRISHDTAAISTQLAAENNLKGLSKDQFIDRAAYYLDHFNHIHLFREGNGRTLQVMMMQLGHQAGYRVDFEKVHKDFNLARDNGIVGVSPNAAENRTRLRYLLAAATSELPGAAAQAARHPDQARLLEAPLPAVAQLEALRELKAASQRVGIRHAQEIGAPLRDAEGQAIVTPLLKFVQAIIMPSPLALVSQQTLNELQKPYVLIAGSKSPQFADRGILQRYSQAVKQAVQAFHPQLKNQQQSVQQPVKLTEQKGKKAPAPPTPPPTPAPTQKPPTPKRRGPKL